MSSEAPGWDAIVEAVPPEFRAEEPLHFGAMDRLPDAGGLYGLNVHRGPDAWLFVTLGLSELFEKVSSDPQVSGWGFELTLLAPREAGETEPPQWPLRLLDSLSRYVFDSGQPFGPGHRLDARDWITRNPADGLTAMAFVPDPIMAPTSSVLGSVGFLRVVGIRADELAAMKASTTRAVIESQIQPGNPRLMTPGRAPNNP